MNSPNRPIPLAYGEVFGVDPDALAEAQCNASHNTFQAMNQPEIKTKSVDVGLVLFAVVVMALCVVAALLTAVVLSEPAKPACVKVLKVRT